MKLNLGLIFGGRSGEHEVSLQSAKSIATALDTSKYNLFLIAIDKEGNWYLADNNHYLDNEENPSAIKLCVKKEQMVTLAPVDNSNRIIRLSDGKDIGHLDVAFPIIHGTIGEDGSLQGYLSVLNIPCIGADVIGSAVGMDKLVAKKLLVHENIPVADFLLADKFSDLSNIIKEAKKKFGFPVFVKPASSGSSVGVSKADNERNLKECILKALQYDNHVLIEEAIKGREIECAILGNNELLASVPGEIIPKNEFYSYEAKYIDSEGAKLDIPAKLDTQTADRVKELAKLTYRALSCSGMARVDMFLTKDNRLILNEINTLPGFTKISMYPKLIGLSGVKYPDLINRLVQLAIDRHREREAHLGNIMKVSSY